MKVGDRVTTPWGLATVRSVYQSSEGEELATVVHDDPDERGTDGYMVYWTKELEVVSCSTSQEQSTSK